MHEGVVYMERGRRNSVNSEEPHTRVRCRSSHWYRRGIRRSLQPEHGIYSLSCAVCPFSPLVARAYQASAMATPLFSLFRHRRSNAQDIQNRPISAIRLLGAFLAFFSAGRYVWAAYWYTSRSNSCGQRKITVLGFWGQRRVEDGNVGAGVLELLFMLSH